MATDPLRYASSVVFAALVFGLGFYALVLYQFALPELIQGAFISFMTLAVQYVFGEAQGASQARRSQRSFEAGVASSPTVTASSGPPASVTVEAFTPVAPTAQQEEQRRG